jgi:hypothetical protein
MTKEDQETKTGLIDLNSTFWRVFLVIFSALLVFAGPTYLVDVLIINIGVGYYTSMIIGFAMFAVGVVLMAYLVRKKVIT